MSDVKREQPQPTQPTTATLEQIAREKLGIATLETQRSDSLDFHEVAVWQLRAALEAAADWNAGAIHEAINAVATRFGVGLGKVAQPLRALNTASKII